VFEPLAQIVKDFLWNRNSERFNLHIYLFRKARRVFPLS
jgi:hypothetical protein